MMLLACMIGLALAVVVTMALVPLILGVDSILIQPAHEVYLALCEAHVNRTVQKQTLLTAYVSWSDTVSHVTKGE